MGLGVLSWIAAVALLATSTPLWSAAAQEPPLRRLEINTFTCEQLAAVRHRLLHEALLVYMNGYLDGTRKATTWDAEVAGKRIEEALRICAANPKSTLLDAFSRAWTQ
jgi:HdeA/HdeB family